MNYTLTWSREVRGLHSTEEQGDSIDEFHSLEDAKAAADRFFRQAGTGNRDTMGMSWAVLLDDSGVVYETEVAR